MSEHGAACPGDTAHHGADRHVENFRRFHVGKPGNVDEAKIEAALRDVMRLTPRGIREHLDLNKPIYARTAAYGHFGRKPDDDGGFSWEKTDLADKLKSHLA